MGYPVDEPQSAEDVTIVYSPQELVDAGKECRESELLIRNSAAQFSSIRAHFELGEEVGLRYSHGFNNHYFPKVEQVRRGVGLIDTLRGNAKDKPAFTGGKVLINKGCHLDWQPVDDYDLIVKPKIPKISDLGYLVSFSNGRLVNNNPHKVLAGAYAFACAKIALRDKIRAESVDSLHSILGLEIHEAGFMDDFNFFLDHLNSTYSGFNVNSGNFMHKVNPYG